MWSGGVRVTIRVTIRATYSSGKCRARKNLSPDSSFMISGWVDFTDRAWNLEKENLRHSLLSSRLRLESHLETKNLYLATLTSACLLRIYNGKTRMKRWGKTSVHCHPKLHHLVSETLHLYQDDTLESFFRPINFISNVSILVEPAGVIESSMLNPVHETNTYKNNRKTLAIVSSLLKCTVAARFSPVHFEFISS